jgi:hypothetical protein
VAGHSPSDLWMKFTQNDGSYHAWNQNHIGQIIKMENGRAVNAGNCPVCGGTTKVTCQMCKGTGQQACLICEGKKIIPEAWTPTDNPWLNRQPDLLRLTDGRILFGKVISTVGDDLTVKQRDGKFIHLKASELKPAP